FLQYNGKTFLISIPAGYAGGEDYVGLLVKPEHVHPLLETEQLDVLTHTEFGNQLFQIASLGAVAHDVVVNVGKSLKNFRHREDCVSKAFLFDQPAHGKQSHGSTGIWSRRAPE